MAVTAKISYHNAKIAEFGQLAGKSDEDHTAISHLTTIAGHLNDVHGLLSGRRRMRRSVAGKRNIS